MRGKRAPKRVITPDPKYNNEVVAKFINYVMRRGKKAVAQKVVYKTLERLEKKSGMPALDAFEKAIGNIMPAIEVRGRRVGGANYQVPVPVTGDRKFALAFRWVIAAAKARKGKPMDIKLADELHAALSNEGEAMKKKQDVQRMAESNRAFAHFARFGRRR
ncbi:MAG: 30S ribosomal protein S7 [Patescibacteria group bacterium]